MYFTPQQLRVAMFSRPLPPILTPRQRVLRQYKRVLETCRDHAGFYREFWYDDVGEVRYQFEQHRHETDPSQIEYFIDKGDKWLVRYRHWAPYRLPYMEDGTKYQRFAEFPAELAEDDRLIDFEAEIMSEYDTPQSDPSRVTWRVRYP